MDEKPVDRSIEVMGGEADPLRRTLLLLVTAALFIGLLVWAVARPFVVMDRIHAAATAGDRAALAKLVDEPAVRAHLRVHIAALVERRSMLASWEPDAKRIVAIDSLSWREHALEACLAPEGFASLLRGVRPRMISEDVVLPLAPKAHRWRGYVGPSRFAETVQAYGPGGEGVCFVLMRRGLDWCLADVELIPAPGGPPARADARLVVAAPDSDAPALGEYVHVDELPEALSRQAPEYPVLAREAGVEGLVLVQALVGRDGMVHDAQVVKSIPMLDDAAVAAVRQWRFKPAQAGGRPVAVWVAIPVRFTLH